MSWVCLPEREEACLPAGCLAGGPFALWKSNLTASECSRSASETDTSSPSRSGMTSAPLTARRGEAPLTSSPEGSLVRTSPAQGEAQGLAAIAQASGLKCSELLARYGLRGSLPKTARCFALEDLPSCSKGLPAWGMMLAGACSELMTSVRRTNANASGLWPTPTTIGNELAPSMQKHAGHRRLIADLMLPTPTAASYGSNQGGAAGRVGKVRHNLEKTAQGLGLLPTPVARERRSVGPADYERNSLSLAAKAQASGLGTGMRFLILREWMMGWPTGWSASKRLATDRFQQWLRSHSEFSARF
jgi:hypothetical protein